MANSMVGKMRRRCSARACFRAVDSDLTEGRASAGTGVERPLSWRKQMISLYAMCYAASTHLVWPVRVPFSGESR